MMRWVIAGCLLIMPAVARADLMPAHTKSAANYVMVEASVPPDRVLIVVNTSQGVTVVVPGVPTIVAGSRRGPLYLKLLAASDVPAPLPTRDEPGAADLWQLRERGQVCSGSFTADRLYPERTPADVKWFHFDVTITGDVCAGVLRAEEYRNRAGDVVEPGDLSVSMDGAWNASEWPVKAGKDVLAIPEPAVVVPREIKEFPSPREVRRMMPPPGDTSAAQRAQGCGCASAAQTGAAWWLAPMGVMLVVTRTRRRSRLSQGTR